MVYKILDGPEFKHVRTAFPYTKPASYFESSLNKSKYDMHILALLFVTPVLLIYF